MRFVKTVENLFGLPQGFTRVETIESTGTQYIDTGVDAKTGLTIEAKIKYVSHAGIFCGAITTSAGNGDRYYAINFSQQNKVAFTYLDTAFTGSTNLTAGNIYTIKTVLGLTRQEIFVDGVSKGYTTKTDNVDLHWTLGLFALHRGGSFTPEWFSESKAILYYCKIWDGDTLVRDFIPCIDPLGVACMYDLVGKKPYYNQGTGTFTAGRQVIPVEYLESTRTQYIDTGVIGDLTTELTCEASITQAGNASVTNIMGNNVTNTRAITINMSANTTNPSTSRIRFGDTDNMTIAGAINLNTFYKYTTNKDNLTVQDSRGVILNTYPFNATTAFTTNGNILIYKLGDTSTQYIGKIKVKGATIKNSGVLVRDFIPCKDENNVGFMFDKVSGTCYLNAGTGAFSVGENKYTSKLRLIKDARIPDGYTRVEYLESTGEQYIDTGYNPTATSTYKSMFELTNITTTAGDWFCVFGSVESNNSTFTELFLPRASGSGDVNQILAGSHNSTYLRKDYTWVKDTKYTFEMTPTNVLINGVNQGSITTDSSITCSHSIYLFARHEYNDAVRYNSSAKIYSFSICNNGTLARSFIPVRDSNNVGYMFDEVTGQLFGNAGSGSFGIGNDLPTAKVRFIQDVIPSDYLPLKYLESTGTQYIDLGVGVKSNTVFKATFSIASTATGRSYFGARNSTNERFQIVNSIGIGGGYYLVNTVYPIANQKYEIEMHANGDMYLDGVKRSATTGTFSQVAFGRNLWLFATNYYDSSVGPGASTFWSAIIYEGDVPVRDLYPALRKSDNKPGMYDRITRQFFVNQGTGEFNYEI